MASPPVSRGFASPPPEPSFDIEQYPNHLQLFLGPAAPLHLDSSSLNKLLPTAASQVTTRVSPCGEILHTRCAGGSALGHTNTLPYDLDRSKSPISVSSLPVHSEDQRNGSQVSPINRFFRQLAIPSSWPRPLPLDLLLSFQQRAWSIIGVPHLVHDERRRSGLRTTIEITRVIHGTWHGRPAVFVGLAVAHTEGVLQQTNVRIDIAPPGLGDVGHEEQVEDPNTHRPLIVRFAPRRHYGSASNVDQSREYGLEGKLAGPGAISDSGLTASAKRTTSSAVQKRQTITGQTSSEPGQSTKTIFRLEAVGNSVTKEGVYDTLPMGMIIETRGRPVVLRAAIKARQGVSNKVWRHVSGRYKYTAPVCIGMEDWVGDGLPEGLGREMDRWDDEVWRGMVNYGEDFENVLVGE